MKRFVRFLLCSTLVAATSPALAITFVPIEATNPINGKKVKVQGLASSGSYVYGWPSKYDLVFAPDYYPEWVWFDPATGYGAFHEDFEKLGEAEIARLKPWLKENYDPAHPPATHLDKLLWLGRVYKTRGKDDGFWRWYDRLMVYMYRDKPADAEPYLREEVRLMQIHLPKAESLGLHEALWVLGDYSRRLGDFEAAAGYFKRLRVAHYKLEDGREGDGFPFFTAMLDKAEPLLARNSREHPALQEEKRTDIE